MLFVLLLSALGFCPGVMGGFASGLIRINRNFEVVSNDMSDYDLYSCKGEGKDRSCSFDSAKMPEYFEGIAFYGLINMLGLFILLIGTAIFIIYALCRCCCRKKKQKDPDTVNLWKVVWFATTIIFLGIILIIATVSGNYAFSESSSDFTMAGKGAQGILMASSPKASKFFISSSADVIAPALKSINDTITNSFSIPYVVEDLSFLNQTIPRLPNVDVILDAVYDVQNVTESPLIDDLFDEIDTLDGQRKDVINGVDALIDDLQDVSDANDILLSSLVSLNSSINEIESIYNDLNGDNGVVESIYDDIVTINRQPDGQFPQISTFESVSNNSYASMPRLISGAMDGDADEISDLNDKLINIYNDMLLLPDYGDTAQDLLTLNDTITDVVKTNGAIDNMISTIQQFEAAIAAYPNLTTISSHVQDLDNIVSSIDLDPAIDLLEELLELFETIPDVIVTLDREVNKMYLLDDMLPSLKRLSDQLLRVNETLIVLPDAMRDIANIYDEVNQTISDALAEVDNMLEQVDDANSTIIDYLDDANGYVLDARNYSTMLTDYQEDFNFTDIYSALADADNLLHGIDFNQTYDSLNDFSASLRALSIDQDFIDALDSAQDSIDSMLSLLQRVISETEGGGGLDGLGDYLQLEGGYCGEDATKACSVDGDCSTTCGGFGEYRCANNGATPCTEDDDCAGSYCLADTDRANELLGLFSIFADDSNDVNTASLEEDLLTILDVSFDFDDMTGIVDDGYDAIDAVNTTDLIVTANGLLDEVRAFNLTEDIQSLNESLTTLSLDDIIETIEDVQDTIHDINDEYYPLIDEYLNTLKSLSDFLFNDSLLGTFLSRMRRPALDTVLANFGAARMITSIFKQFDFMMDHFDRNQESFDVPFTNVSKGMLDDFEVVDRLGANEAAGFGDMRKHGSLYYIFQLINSSDYKTVHSRDPLLQGMFANKNGERYAGDAVCLTEACVEHTANVVNSEPMNTWEDEFPGQSFPPVPLSREQLFLLVWAPVVIVIIFASAAMIVGVGCTKKYRAERHLSNITVCCTICQLPWMFLLTAFLFPLCILLSDGCDNWNVIGESYLTSYGDDFCHNMFGGNGTLRACAFNETIDDSMGGGHISYSVDILAAYRGFTGECNRVDPFASVLLDIAEQVKPLPRRASDKQILEDTDIEIRQPIINIVNETADDLGTLLSDIVVDLADIFQCKDVAAVVSYPEEVVCESYFKPLFWFVGMVYLASWVLCCCVLPAAAVSHYKKSMHVSPSMEELPPRDVPAADDVGEEKEGVEMAVVPHHNVEVRNFSDISTSDHATATASGAVSDPAIVKNPDGPEYV